LDGIAKLFLLFCILECGTAFQRGNAVSHQPSDEELMPQLKKGRMEAFEMLLARYRKPIFSFILRMLGDFHRAQDVFQETFLRVFRHAQRFDESLRFKFFACVFFFAVCYNIYVKFPRG
jgi:hypothetical protein